MSIAATSSARCAVGGRIGDEDGLGFEDVADRPEAVHDERRAGRHEVDDGIGQAEPRGDFDRARDRDDIGRDPALVEEPAGGVRMGRRDTKSGQILDRLVRGIGRDRRREPALAEAELPKAGQLCAGLHEEVDAGHAQVGDTVTDELDDVVRADEQHVEIEVPDAGDEAPVVLVEDEAGVVEEGERRFDEPALVRDREAEALPHRSFRTG